MKKGTHIQVTIGKVGFKGVGIGVLSREENPEVHILDDEIGKKVLVQNTLPGEVVVASVKRNKKKYIEADKVETVRESEMAVKAQCKHFAVCGGCKWQNLPYEEQLKIKEAHVRESLEHLGGFDSALVDDKMRPIIGCENNWQYRNKVELSFGWDENMEQTYGFHVEGRRYDIFDIEECFLMSERMLEVAKVVGKFVQDHGLQPFKFKENKGLLRSVVIREGKRTGEILVDLLCSGEKFSESLKEAFVSILQVCGVNSIYVTHIVTARGQKTTRQDVLLDGGSVIREQMSIDGQAFSFHISPSSFFQPNTLQAEVLYHEAIGNLELKESDVVLDLFCGTGTIGIILSKFVYKVMGIELNTDAVEDARKNAALNEENNIEFIAGDVGKVLENFEVEGRLDELKGRKIVIDPPRSGLTPQMIEYILKLEPSHIAYVSCNPTTQARDLKEICEAGYDIHSIQPVDMFPHTYHIENVVGLKKQ